MGKVGRESSTSVRGGGNQHGLGSIFLKPQEVLNKEAKNHNNGGGYPGKKRKTSDSLRPRKKGQKGNFIRAAV